MVTLAMGLEHLRLSDFFEENAKPSLGDRERLEDGRNFLRRILAALNYFEDGQVDGLEEVAFSEFKYVRATEKKLLRAAKSPAFRAYLQRLSDTLTKYIETGVLSKRQRADLATFFDVVGEAMITEEFEAVPTDDPEALGSWASLEESYA